jgi:hypothetical protein
MEAAFSSGIGVAPLCDFVNAAEPELAFGGKLAGRTIFRNAREQLIAFFGLAKPLLFRRSCRRAGSHTKPKHEL